MRRPWAAEVLYLVFKPQFAATRSIRPSPSKSPAVIPFHQPLKCEIGTLDADSVALEDGKTDTDGSQGVRLPWLLRKRRSGPHSQANTSSGNPSPLRSVQTAELT